MTQQDTIPEFISNETVEELFESLDGLSVRLEKDPTVLGPSYVHVKLKECRDHSIKVEGLLVQFYDVERRVKNLLAGLKEAHKAQTAEMLVLDDDVRKGRSASEREAIVDFKLKQDIVNINDLKEQLINVSYVLKAVELKKEGLNRTNNDIKKQVSLMEFAKSNATPIDEDYGDLPMEPDTTPLEETSEDLEAVLQGDLQPEAPPDEIPESLELHMASEEDGDPVADDAIAGLGDIDEFLQEMDVDTDPEPEEEEDVSDVVMDDEEVDIEALLNIDPLDEKEDDEPVIEVVPDDPDAAPEEDDEPELEVEDTVVDIGAFLDADA